MYSDEVAVIKLPVGAFLGDQPLVLDTQPEQAKARGRCVLILCLPSLPSTVYSRQGPVYSPRRQVHRVSNSALEIIKDLLSPAGRREQRGEWRQFPLK